MAAAVQESVWSVWRKLLWAFPAMAVSRRERRQSQLRIRRRHRKVMKTRHGCRFFFCFQQNLSIFQKWVSFQDWESRFQGSHGLEQEFRTNTRWYLFFGWKIWWHFTRLDCFPAGAKDLESATGSDSKPYCSHRFLQKRGQEGLPAICFEDNEEPKSSTLGGSQ